MRKSCILLMFFMLIYTIIPIKTYAYDRLLYDHKFNSDVNYIYCLNDSGEEKEDGKSLVNIKSIDIDNNKIIPKNDQIIVPCDAQRIVFNIEILKDKLNNNSISYYLDGFDKTPLKIKEGSDAITYTNLKGGNYKFYLIVTDENGTIINEQVVEIHKNLSFFEYKLFRIVVGIAAILILVIFYRKLLKENTRKLNEQYERYEKLVDETITAIANTIDAKDKDINGHSRRVAEYSAEIAKKMNMSDEMVKVIYYTGLLHDIGKIGIPDNILNKPSELTEEEYEIIKKHTTIGGDILKEITIVSNIADGAKYHHEKYDGTGYIEGLKGNEIPLAARIVGVADTYDAMHSDRVYRKGLSDEYILEEFRRCAGKQFDPEISAIAIELLEEKLEKKYKKSLEKKYTTGREA